MHATRPATTGIGHARGMKPICVEHRRACNFASLSFPCFVDRTRACMHACMHRCGGECGDLLCERGGYVAFLSFFFLLRLYLSIYLSPFFVSAIYTYIEKSGIEKKWFGLILGRFLGLIGDFFFYRGEKVSICLVYNFSNNRQVEDDWIIG